MKKWCLLAVVAVLFQACQLKVTTHTRVSPLPNAHTRTLPVYDVSDTRPANSRVLGTVLIKDDGFASKCSYQDALQLAQLSGQKMGGDALKLVVHILPSSSNTTCHQLMAEVLELNSKQPDSASIPGLSIGSQADAEWQEEYAKLNIYRNNRSSYCYNLFLDDSLICRTHKQVRTTVFVKPDRYSTLWARGDVKVMVPLQLEIGKEYFVRCEGVGGILAPRPMIFVIDSQLGRKEFDIINTP